MMLHPQHPQIKLLSYVNIISLSKSNNPPEDLSKKRYFFQDIFLRIFRLHICICAVVQL